VSIKPLANRVMLESPIFARSTAIALFSQFVDIDGFLLEQRAISWTSDRRFTSLTEVTHRVSMERRINNEEVPGHEGHELFLLDKYGSRRLE